MDRMMNEKWPWIEAAQGMRSQLLDLLVYVQAVLIFLGKAMNKALPHTNLRSKRRF